MAQGNPELQKYYTYLKSRGADVPPDYNTFSTTLDDPAEAQKYYGYLKKNKFDTPDTYESFATTFDLGKPQPNVQQPPANQPWNETPDINKISDYDANLRIDKTPQELQKANQQQKDFNDINTAYHNKAFVPITPFKTDIASPTEKFEGKDLRLPTEKELEQVDKPELQQKAKESALTVGDYSGVKHLDVADTKEVAQNETNPTKKIFLYERALDKLNEKSQVVTDQKDMTIPNEQADVMAELSTLYYNEGDYKKAYENANTAIDIFESNKLKPSVIKVGIPSLYKFRANAALELGLDPNKALKDAEEAARFGIAVADKGSPLHEQKEGEYYRIADSYDVASKAAAKAGNAELATKYNNLSLANTQHGNDISGAKSNERQLDYIASGGFENDFFKHIPIVSTLKETVEGGEQALLDLSGGYGLQNLLKSLSSTPKEAEKNKKEIEEIKTHIDAWKGINETIGSVFSGVMTASPQVGVPFQLANEILPQKYLDVFNKPVSAIFDAVLKAEGQQPTESFKGGAANFMNSADNIGMLLLFHAASVGMKSGMAKAGDFGTVKKIAEYAKKINERKPLSETEVKEVQKIIEDIPTDEVKAVAENIKDKQQPQSFDNVKSITPVLPTGETGANHGEAMNKAREGQQPLKKPELPEGYEWSEYTEGGINDADEMPVTEKRAKELGLSDDIVKYIHDNEERVQQKIADKMSGKKIETVPDPNTPEGQKWRDENGKFKVVDKDGNEEVLSRDEMESKYGIRHSENIPEGLNSEINLTSDKKSSIFAKDKEQNGTNSGTTGISESSKTREEFQRDNEGTKGKTTFGTPQEKTDSQLSKIEDTPLYHGTNVSFDAFDNSHKGEGLGRQSGGGGIYLTDSPETALNIGDEVTAKKGGDFHVYDVRVKGNNFLRDQTAPTPEQLKSIGEINGVDFSKSQAKTGTDLYDEIAKTFGDWNEKGLTDEEIYDRYEKSREQATKALHEKGFTGNIYEDLENNEYQIFNEKDIDIKERTKINPETTEPPAEEKPEEPLKTENHQVYYNGKVVDMGYTGKEQFKYGAQRISDNLGTGGYTEDVGYVKTPDGKIYEVSRSSKKAKLLEGDELAEAQKKFEPKEPEPKVEAKEEPKPEPAEPKVEQPSRFKIALGEDNKPVVIDTEGKLPDKSFDTKEQAQEYIDKQGKEEPEKKVTSKEQAKAKLDEARQAFRKAGGLSSGGFESLPEFIKLIAAYIDYGIKSAKQAIEQFRKDYPELDTKVTDKHITDEYNKQKGVEEKETPETVIRNKGIYDLVSHILPEDEFDKWKEDVEGKKEKNVRKKELLDAIDRTKNDAYRKRNETTIKKINNGQTNIGLDEVADVLAELGKLKDEREQLVDDKLAAIEKGADPKALAKFDDDISNKDDQIKSAADAATKVGTLASNMLGIRAELDYEARRYDIDQLQKEYAAGKNKTVKSLTKDELKEVSDTYERLKKLNKDREKQIEKDKTKLQNEELQAKVDELYKQLQDEIAKKKTTAEAKKQIYQKKIDEGKKALSMLTYGRASALGVLNPEIYAALGKIARGHIEKFYNEAKTKIEIKSLIKNTLDEVKEIMPDLTEKDVMDAITGNYKKAKVTKTELGVMKTEISKEIKIRQKYNDVFDKEDLDSNIEDLKKELADEKNPESENYKKIKKNLDKLNEIKAKKEPPTKVRKEDIPTVERLKEEQKKPANRIRNSTKRNHGTSNR